MNDVIANEDGSFCRACLGMLQATLPLQHSPTRIVVLRHLAENRAKIHLSVAQRTEASRPLHPILVAAINAAVSIRSEFGVFHMKRAHPFVVEVEKCEIVQLLQYHVARVKEDVRALVSV